MIEGHTRRTLLLVGHAGAVPQALTGSADAEASWIGLAHGCTLRYWSQMGREFDQSNRLLHATRLARRGSYADALSLTTQIVIQCPWSLRRWKRLAGAVFWLARLKVAP